MNRKVFIILIFISIFFYTLFSAVKIGITFAPDFSIFYNASRDVVKGISPYTDKTLFTAFNYPLVTTIFFIPFSFLPYKIAQDFFVGLNTISVFAIVFVCFQLLRKKVTLSKYLLFLSLIYLSFPIKFTFGMGQTNLLAYAFLLAGFLFLQNDKKKRAIIFLLLGIFLKPILAITLIILCLQKKWRAFFIICIFGLSLFFLIPIIFHQPNANTLFINQLTKQSTLGREIYYNQGVLGFVSRLINNLLGRSLFTIAASIIFALVALVKIKTRNLVQQLSLLLTLLVIIDPLSWQHHFAFLILPFLLTWFEIMKHKSKRRFSVSLLIIAYALVSWNFKNPQMFTAFPWNLLLSHQLYGAIILFILQIVM